MLKSVCVSLSLFAATAASADNEIRISSGQTSVLLDTATLSAAASLDLSGVAGNVIAPGELGEASVAFPINARSAKAAGGLLPTTFAYDLGDFLGTFTGAIEHEGSVLFNDDAVEVGNFTIGFDGSRASKTASGFFVESTVGIPAILFDVAAPSVLDAGGESLVIEADLLVSPEFAAFLFDNGLAASDLTGADVGDARVNGDAGCSGVDVDDNGRVRGRDLFRFILTYVAERPGADFNGDGFRSPQDVRDFFRVLISCFDR